MVAASSRTGSSLLDVQLMNTRPVACERAACAHAGHAQRRVDPTRAQRRLDPTHAQRRVKAADTAVRLNAALKNLASTSR